MNQWQTLQALDHKKPFDHAKSKTQYQSFQLDSPTSGQLNICPLTALGMARYYKLLTGVVKVPHEKPQEDPQPCADLGSAWPDIPHMVTDSLCCRHGTGQLPGLDDGGAAQLHCLQSRRGGGENMEWKGRRVEGPGRQKKERGRRMWIGGEERQRRERKEKNEGRRQTTKGQYREKIREKAYQWLPSLQTTKRTWPWTMIAHDLPSQRKPKVQIKRRVIMRQE